MKTILSILTAVLVAGVAYAPPVGSTSEWGIVITPCAWCGATNNIEVHHIWPQHVYPQYAHDTNRMVCLCRRCHLVVGHKGNFTNVFTNVMSVILIGK
jgi:hypothetical protein